MKKRESMWYIIVILLLAGCGPTTLNNAEREGKKALDAREIFDLVSGNTMELTAHDFGAKVFFSENGALAASDNVNLQDSGTWDIKADNMLCLKFQVWYYGDLRCYAVVPMQGDRFTFYTANGASYYVGSLHRGDYAGLKKTAEFRRSNHYLREKLAAEKLGTPAESAAETEIAQPVPAAPKNQQIGRGSAKTATDLKRLAKNCPDCNLSGADLYQADLMNANLQGADLSGADLRYANLRRANLSRANLRGARLSFANMPGADLRDANLADADLSGANLLLADLTGADLTNTVLTNAHLENTKGIANSQ